MGSETTPLKEIFGSSEENCIAMLDDVIKDIFVSCDVEGAGTVQTSKLTEFIAPFLQADVVLVGELRKSLDPHDTNPAIDIATFHNYMKEWTLKIKSISSDAAEGEDFHNVTPREFHRLDDGDMSFIQSTPRSSFGHHLLKGYVEFGAMNSSGCSTYSLTDFPSTKGPERTILEEHIQELEYQKRKITEELTRVKGELAISSETIESLHIELEKTLKKLKSSEQRFNDQLRMGRKQDDDHEAELNNMKKHVVRLEKLVSTMEKQMMKLNDDLREMQVENEKLEERNMKLAKKKEEALQEIVSLQTEIEVWKHELASAQKITSTFKEENRNLQEIIEQRNSQLDKLKIEKGNMERLLSKPICSSPPVTGISRSNSFSEYSPTLKQLLTKQHMFNTPKTMFKLKNPVSPLPNDSPLDFVPKPGDTSTPDQDEKLILDSTNPSLEREVLTPQQSLPTLHVIDRTEDMPNATSESLHEEISKVTEQATYDCSFSSEDEYHHKHKCHEIEKRVTDVHQKQSSDLEELTEKTKNYELKISQLHNELINLRTQSCLSSDKETMLLERNRSLEEMLSSKISHIADITTELDEYHRLEIKSKELKSKIEYLEKDNRVKYMKIVELTIEVDRLRNLKKSDVENESNVEEVIKGLTEETRVVKMEKRALEKKLKLMETERITLDHEKSTLLLERDGLKSDNENLRIEISTLQMSLFESMETIRILEMEKKIVENETEVMENENEIMNNENEFETNENETMRIENENLKWDFENLEDESAELEMSSAKFEIQQQLVSLNSHYKELNRRREELEEELSVSKRMVEENNLEINTLRQQKQRYEEECMRNNEDMIDLKSEKQSLNSQLKNLSTEIEEYRKRSEGMNEALQKENLDLKSRINRSHEINSNLVRENQDLTSKLEKIEVTSKEQDIENKQLIQENLALKMKVEKSETSIVSYAIMNDKVIIANEELQKLLQKRDQLITELENEVESLKNINQDLQIEMKKLSGNLREFENTKTSLKQKEDYIVVIERQSTVLKETKQSLNEQVFVLNEMCENYKHKLEESDTQLKVFANLAKQKDATLRDRELTISRLQEEINQKMRLIDDLNQQFEKAKKVCEELEKTKKKLEGEHRRSYHHPEEPNEILNVKNLELQNNNLKDLNKDNPNNLIVDLKAEIRVLSEQNHFLKEENKELSIRDKAKISITSFSDIPQKMNTTEKNLLGTEEDYYRREIDKYNVENVKYKNEIAALLAEKTAIKNCLNKAESDYKIAKNELDDLLIEKESWLSQTNQKKPDSPFERYKSDSKLPKRSSFDKLSIIKEKLESKVQDLKEELLHEKRALTQALTQKSTAEKEFAILKIENCNLKAKLINVEEEIAILMNKTKAEEMAAGEQKKELLIKRMEEERLATYDQLDHLRETLSEKRFKMERYTLTVGTSFKIPEGVFRKILTCESTFQTMPENLVHFKKEISGIQEQMEVTSNVLDYLVTKRAKTIYQNTGCQTETIDAERPEERKPRSSTFTLRPSSLIPKNQQKTSNPVDDKFASSGDAGPSRDLGVRLPTAPEEENTGFAKEEVLNEDVSSTLNENILEDVGLLERELSCLGEMEDEELTVTARQVIETSMLTLKNQQLAGELAACKKLLEDSLGGDHLIMALRRLETVLGRCTQQSISAAQFGSLKHERLMVTCVGLMINYAACIRKRLENDQLRFIGQHIKLDSSRQLQITDFERVGMKSVTVPSKTYFVETNVSPRPSTRAKQTVTRYLIIWIVVVVIFSLFLISALHWDGNTVHFILPWGWRSFDDPWSPLIKKRYVNGPAPT